MIRVLYCACGRPKAAQKLKNINGFTEEGLQ
jgi:hypothetical protein